MIRIPPPGAPAVDWKRRALIVLGVVLALSGAFSAGRFSAPEKVREVEKVVWKDRAEEKASKKKTKAVDRVVFVDRVVSPSGEVREKRMTKTLTDAREVAEVAKTTESTGNAEKSTATTARPDWRVGVLAGASLQPPALPIAGPLVIGVQVERRIAGGLSAGAWANTSGAAGALVSLEF